MKKWNHSFQSGILSKEQRYQTYSDDFLYQIIFAHFWSHVWNLWKVQTYIFTEIDKAVQEKRDIRTKEVLESLQARFKKEDDVVMLEDDQPPGAYDIGEDIVHEWFLSNYEESPAPNMCIYKRELFKVQ